MTSKSASRPSEGTEPFLGSRAISEGLLSPRELRSSRFIQVFHNVYVPGHRPVTHELLCRAAALIAPGTATLTGASAATVRGRPLAAAGDPVEFVVPESDRFGAKRGLHIRRSVRGPAEGEPWRGIRLATPERATLDILRDKRLRPSLPRTVAWADALLRDGFVDATAFSVFLSGRHDHGVVRVRKAWALVDPRSTSVPESELRVWLRLSGLVPRLLPEVLGFRLGLCFPDNKLSVELEREWDGNLERARQDAWRRRRLRAHGWESVVVPHRQLEADPTSAVEMVRSALHGSNAAVAA
ncbi:MAG TPA: hypothetical protein VFG87_21570 [Amycolatopsis sp.]|nr:hypothetical protein [Amycolatopsis sp.]